MSLVNPKHKAFRTKTQIAAVDKSEYERIRSRSNMHKGARPWELADVTQDLDRSQPWIGMEWENGFTSLAKYQQAVDFVWASFHGVTVDAEGPGPWFGEFTFSPANLSDFNAGTTAFDGLLNFMHDNNIRMPLSGSDLERMDMDGWVDPNPDPVHGARPSPDAYWCRSCNTWHGGGADPTARFYSTADLRRPWGMHVNISMPDMRDASYDDVEYVEERMNDALQRLTEKERIKFFGRQPYGWCYTVGSGDRYWWEFKLFRTTDDKEVIAGYKTVINGLVKMLEIFSSSARVTISKEDMVSMLSGTYTG